MTSITEGQANRLIQLMDKIEEIRSAPKVRDRKGKLEKLHKEVREIMKP